MFPACTILHIYNYHILPLITSMISMDPFGQVSSAVLCCILSCRMPWAFQSRVCTFTTSRSEMNRRRVTHEMFDCDHHTTLQKNLFEGLYHLEEIWFQHWGMGPPCSAPYMLIQALLSYTIWLDHQRPKRAESPIESNRQYWVSDQKRLRLISWNSKEPTSSNCSRVSR